MRPSEEASASQRGGTSVPNGEGLASSPRSRPLLGRLLEVEPVQAARWVLSCVKKVEMPPKGGERTAAEPLMRLASEFKDAPLEQIKAAFTSALVTGFMDLPAEDRVDLLRVTLRITAGRKPGLLAKGVLSLPVPAMREAEERALRNEASQEDLALLATAVNPKRADLAFFYLAMVVDRWGMDRMGLDGPALAGAAWKALHTQPAVTVLEMAIELVTQLDEVGRKQLIVIVKEDDDLSENHRLFVENSVAPGGYADQLLDLLRMGNRYTLYLLLLSIMALGEGLLADLLPHCSTRLDAWLSADASLWLVAALSAWYLGYEVRPLIADTLESMWSEDEGDAGTRDGSDAGDLEKSGAETASDAGRAEREEKPQRGTCLLYTIGFLLVFALLSGFIAAIVAVVEVILNLGDCAVSLEVVTVGFVVLRILLTLSLVLWIWSAYKEVSTAYALFLDEAEDPDGQTQKTEEAPSSSTPMGKGETPQYGACD